MNKVLTFIIGFLVGAIVATGGFLVYQKVVVDKNVPNINREQMMEFRDGRNRGGMPQDGEFPQNGEMPENGGNFKKGNKSQKINQDTSKLMQNTI